ncbi:type II toxin-antitoxin system RnlB family antitoxin [Clostridium perfringens]|uniref:type II toxin-antitoxin system RnlB family antitoxin n=1 Tax=Clostridium perfringens TaxID=1502 RepID=UPI0024BC66A4|nr:type II toxin-antitoxin system RnlB family antitoxin [Clostridium perfringens]
MKEYNILKLYDDTECINLVIMCNANSPFDYIEMIKDDLIKCKLEGKIIIDQILHVGNTKKRFISMKYENGEFMINHDFENISKGSLVRRVSCNYLKENKLVDYSILTSIQKRMINKGITI